MVGLSVMFPRVEVFLIQGSPVDMLERPPMDGKAIHIYPQPGGRNIFQSVIVFEDRLCIQYFADLERLLKVFFFHLEFSSSQSWQKAAWTSSTDTYYSQWWEVHLLK